MTLQRHIETYYHTEIDRMKQKAYLDTCRKQWIKKVIIENGGWFQIAYIGQFQEKPTDDDILNKKQVMLKRKRLLRTIGRETQIIKCFRTRLYEDLNHVLVNAEEWHLFDKKPEVAIRPFGGDSLFTDN